MTSTTRRVIGPIFFTTKIKAAVYRDIVQQFISLLTPEERYCTFQQDNATAYTAHDIMNMLA